MESSRLGFRQAASMASVGALQARGGRYDEAERSVLQALAADPASAHALELLGAIRLKLGNPAGAREAWEKCLAVQPENDRVRDLLKRLDQTR